MRVDNRKSAATYLRPRAASRSDCITKEAIMIDSLKLLRIQPMCKLTIIDGNDWHVSAVEALFAEDLEWRNSITSYTRTFARLHPYRAPESIPRLAHKAGTASQVPEAVRPFLETLRSGERRTTFTVQS